MVSTPVEARWRVLIVVPSATTNRSIIQMFWTEMRTTLRDTGELAMASWREIEDIRKDPERLRHGCWLRSARI